VYVIGTDIGGTFTDCAVVDQSGKIVASSKHPSTPDDPVRGIVGVLDVVAIGLGISRQALLSETELFMHGTTIATNAMIERKGAVTGLITSKGHEDTLRIGRVSQKVAGLPESVIIHESRLRKPEPPVLEPANTLGVAERLDWQGRVVVPLNETQAVRAVGELIERGVESIAVTFLYSFRNSAHERRLVELVRERDSRVFVAASHEIAPVMGEYERTATTVLTCYLGPKVSAYVERLDEALKSEGFRGQLFFMHADGGVTIPAEAKRRPLMLLDSGPVGGSLGSKYFAAIYSEPSVICTDMGGTSFDVSIITRGELHKEEQAIIEQYTVAQQKVEIATIGSGGGSIVWVDEDGILHVGPESAGAVPGPACYDAGGSRPTVTDADLILGYLNPDYFLGGRIRLNRERARQAFQSVAARLGLSIEDAALGAVRVVNAQMADIIRRNTIEKGLDPRHFALFSYGGAGPTHAPFFGRDLHVKAVYIPHYASVFSALGMVTADLLHTAEKSLSVRLPFTGDTALEANKVFGGLESELFQQLKSGGIGTDGVRIERFVYMKYGLQVHQIAVPVERRDLSTEGGERLSQGFEAEYERMYGRGTGYRQAGIEIVKGRVVAHCQVPAPKITKERQGGPSGAASLIKSERQAFFQPGGAGIIVKVLDGERLAAGHALRGPVIIERPGDTVVVPPETDATVDEFLNIRIDIA
jgi:N-methylhydantoinase A